MQGKKCAVCKIIGALAGIGALNWGLVGIFHFDLVGAVLGDMTVAARVVYVLVGIAGLILLVSLVKCCPCSKDSSSCSTQPPQPTPPTQ